jgi:hypothetical protein
MDEDKLMTLYKIRRCGIENKKRKIEKNDDLFFLKSLNELDNDLRKLVKYNESNKTITVRSLSNNDNWISISYSDHFNKFVIQTPDSLSTFNNINYIINYQTRSRFRHYLLDIEFNFTDNNKNTSFKLVRETSNQFDVSFFEHCKKTSLLDYDNLEYYSESSFFGEFELFHKNKITQIKKVIDEYVKSRKPNLKYLSCKTKSKKCLVRKL